MTANPRRWFQIHLSTAIVLMFVAGGLLWLNLVPAQTVLIQESPDIIAPVKVEDVIKSDKLLAIPKLVQETDKHSLISGLAYMETNGSATREKHYGWPWHCAEATDLVELRKGSVSSKGGATELSWNEDRELCLDLAIALAILGATAVILEIFIRRRAARKK